MKKFVIILMIVFTGFIIAGCVFDTVHYCPYCKSANIEKVENKPGVYKCKNDKCGKTFGAMLNPVIGED